ncbi:chromosome partitioning protein [Agrococcus jenensis]|uniref:Chromosome partitioning protein n=2 Tax=Agrococcus jenensis TaxID=46353 RepID=A0A3N2ARE1_9MICO|nr:chromosome partitioning protein [Agrococcus jenensis]
MTTGKFDTTPIARELAAMARRRQALSSVELPLPKRTRIFTVVNQKGGVGKTTTAVNLAAALAQGGARVLVLDLDPQGNASTALGIDHHADVVSTYDVLIEGEPLQSAIAVSPQSDRLQVVPSTIHLAGADLELAAMEQREHRLRKALDAYLSATSEPPHYIFIDCPPSLGLLTINAFTAATEVLLPIQCEYYALEGVSQLMDTIERIKAHLNPTLDLSTVLLTMFDGRTLLSRQVVDEVRKHFPEQTLDAIIPRSVRVSEAPGYGQTVIAYDPNSPGALSYREAAAEIARRGTA